MRKRSSAFAFVLVLSIFSNKAFSEPQPQSFTLSFFSFIKELFLVETKVPMKHTAETTVNTQTPLWLHYFIFQKDWENKSKENLVTNRIASDVAIVSKSVTIKSIEVAQPKITKTIQRPNEKTVIITTSKVSTKPEPINMNEMMMILEEVGAGSMY